MEKPMLDHSHNHTNFLIFLLIIVTSAQAISNEHKYQCFHQASLHSLINFLENCQEDIKKKGSECKFIIPSLRSNNKKFVTEEEVLTFVSNALDKSKDDYKYRNSPYSSCTGYYCRAAGSTTKNLFTRHKLITMKTKEEKEALIKNAPLLITDCTNAEHLALYLWTYRDMWGKFSAFNNLKHIDGKFFISNRTTSQKKYIEKKPECLEGSTP